MEESPEAFAGLAERLLPAAVPIGSRAGTSIRRWQDASGARLTFAVRRRSVEDVVLSLDAEPGAILRDAKVVDRFTVRSDLVDEVGEQVTALVAAFDVGPLIEGSYSGPAAMIALGERVTIHADAESFHATPDSRFGDADGEGDHVVAHRSPTVPGFAAESFLSYGVFASVFGNGPPTPHAKLHGTVVAAVRRTNLTGGGSFVVARVRTAGFLADICLSAAEHPVPAIGSIVGGDVYLVGTIPAWPRTAGPGIVGRLRHLGRRSTAT